MRKNILFLIILMGFHLMIAAQTPESPKMKSLKLQEIRTATDRILVAYFLGPDMNEIPVDPNRWSLNGKQPRRIDRWITPNWEGVESGYEHHIYLTMDEPFVQGKKYHLKTPGGEMTFSFDSREIFCESIKTNQSAYSALSKKRFANFAVWTGTGGGSKIDGRLPEYDVFEVKTGKTVTRGTLSELGRNDNSGDFVYRIDLSKVPEGGPYKINLEGFGCSYPFGVGGQFSKRLAYVSFRGLLYERCGIEQKKPYFDHDIRDICHPEVYVTDSPSREARVNISASDRKIKTHGGYHDAGDADRRDHHMLAPMVLLTYYDMFPGYFTDRQYNIPDKFDSDFRPIGQGNGIPDIIDEAEWGTAIFEILQEKNGGVRSGTERTGYPKDGPTLDTDTDQYATFRVSDNSTTLAAGLFAQLARIMKPFDKNRAAELQKRAENAWAYAGDSALITHKIYFLVQYYLLTGDENIHRQLAEIAPQVAMYEKTHMSGPRNLSSRDVLLGAHFFSYLVQNERPKNAEIVRCFKDAIRKAADARIRELNENPYPNGTSNPNRWWGSQTAQGQYADPLLMQWRLTGEQKYIDAASQLMDYNQGLNPIGKCYLTGTGFDRAEDPLHHDSYSMKEKGWGPAPGLPVFGPGNIAQLKENCPLMIPDIKTLPAQRQWLDSRKNVSGCEFTIPESIAFPSVIYTILSGGGMWDRKTSLYPENKTPEVELSMVDHNATPETKALYANLWMIRQKGVLFGHHDYPSYGVGWSGDEDRSDVSDITGDYPAVYSLDMRDITPAKIDFIKAAHRRGGISMLVWHQNNPLTQSPGAPYPVGTAWDKTKVVDQILQEGSAMNIKYKKILDDVAAAFFAMKDDKGSLIPVIFRPLHEHTQSWSWWGTAATTGDEFVDFWRFIVHYLRDVKGVHNVIYAISPQMDAVYDDPLERLQFRWPGNDYVDFVGMDCYHGRNTAAFISNVKSISELSKMLMKPVGVTETGLENNHTADYWTNNVLEPLIGSNCVMVVAWRNEKTSHAFGPYPADISAEDFRKFYNDRYTIFERDLPRMYKMPEGITVK